MSKSLYDTLGVNTSSSQDDIKKAYRRLARKYHPDINKDPQAEKKFKEINAAYEVLSDAKRKQQYDKFGDSMFGGKSFSDFAQEHNASYSSLDDMLRSIFKDAGGSFRFNSSGSFGDFGGRSFGNYGFENIQKPNLDIITTITIPFDKSTLGGVYTVSINQESFDIKIPFGIKNGEKLRVKNRGRVHQGLRGDLYLKVNIEPSKEYKREGDNLEKIVNIPLKIALFGGKIKVNTLYRDVIVKIAKETKNNQVLRVKRFGVKNRKTLIKGDLYIKINVSLPSLDKLDGNLLKMMKEKLPSEEL